MKKSNSKQKAQSAFKKLGAVALITATMFFTACNQAGGGGGEKLKPAPKPTKYTVTLTQTANGNVTASPAIPTDKQVDKDTLITFTAEAKDGYKIGKWKVTGSALEANTGADGSKTAKVKITADTQVSVSFEAIPPTKYTVTLTQTEGGTVTALPEIPANKLVVKDTVITFTATADAGYKVKGWTLDGNAVNGTNTEYKLKVTQAATVKVSFEEIPKHAINFNVEGGNGTLKAKSDGIPETEASPITVEEGKTVTFTAEPSTNYKVKEWKVGDTVVTGNKTNTYPHTVTQATTVSVSFELIPQAILTLSSDTLTIRVKAKTADGSDITVEGCNETTLKSDTQTGLRATGTKVILKGKITVLSCYDNKLTALNVSGLTSLQELYCHSNKLTSLDVQGLTSLQELYCYTNQLTSLNMQGLTSLKVLSCYANKLNAEEMTKLLNALPARVAGDNAKATLYTEQASVTENNCKDYTKPEDLKKAFDKAKERNWKLKKRNASGKWEEI